jgi:hypothetical protein
MAELVKSGAQLVEGQESGLASWRLGDVEVVDYHRLAPEQGRLFNE